jgi:hypothetical protein
MAKRKESFLSEVENELAQIRHQAEVVGSKKKKKEEPRRMRSFESIQRLVVENDLTKIGVPNWLNQLKDSGQITFFNDFKGKFGKTLLLDIRNRPPKSDFGDDSLVFTHEGVFLRVGLTSGRGNTLSEVFIGVKKKEDMENLSFPYSVGLYEADYSKHEEENYRPSNCAKFNSLMGERSGYSCYGVERGLINLVSIYEYNMGLINQNKSPQFDQSEFVRFGE